MPFELAVLCRIKNASKIVILDGNTLDAFHEAIHVCAPLRMWNFESFGYFCCDFFDRFLKLIGNLLNDLLCLTDGLICLAFLAKCVVASQCASGIFDSTLNPSRPNHHCISRAILREAERDAECFFR